MGQQTKRKNTKVTPQTTVRSPDTSFPIVDISPATEGQVQVKRNVKKYDVLSLRGMPGTGKTFWAMYLGFTLLFDKSTKYKKMVIVRSTVPVRKSGFLPGTAGEKNAPYESPYIKHCTKIFGRGDAYEILKKKQTISFDSTDFLRGTEWNDTIVIVDEPQNMADTELHTINTRFGDNCKMFFCGDTGQDDLSSDRYKEYSGYARMNRIHDQMSSAFSVVFGIDDIIRSGYIKQYLIAREDVLQ